MRGAAAGALLILIAHLATLLSPAGLYGEQQPFSWQSSAVWEQGVLVIDTRTPVDPGEKHADLRYRAQRRIERQLPALILEAVLPVALDSLYTVGERIKQDELLFQAMRAAAAAGVSEESSSLSRDFGEVRIRYRLPLFGPKGLATVFVTHSRPYPMQPVLGFVPSRPFTGLVVYARGQVPAHGKQTRESVRPALFPRLFDEELNLVLSPEMCRPESVKAWGVAAYSYSGERPVDLERVGAFPLRTVARGVFGKNSTDLLLSGEAVRQLLSLEANRRMLQEGRILIVLDPPAAH